MTFFRANSFATQFQSKTVELQPWTQLRSLAHRLINTENADPKIVENYFKALIWLLSENDGDDFLDAAIEEFGNDMSELKSLIESRTGWENVFKLLSMLNTLSLVRWESQFDPEVDPDRFGEKLKPSHRLPRCSEEIISGLNDNVADSFGSIIWSQNSSMILLEFENVLVTKSDLVVEVDNSGLIIVFTLSTSGRSLKIHLFDKVEPCIKVEDTFAGAGARLLLYKTKKGHWSRLEAVGKRVCL